jgi:hypothetical protein
VRRTGRRRPDEIELLVMLQQELVGIPHHHQVVWESFPIGLSNVRLKFDRCYVAIPMMAIPSNPSVKIQNSHKLKLPTAI